MKTDQCKVENCHEPIHAKGYCRKHYARKWRERAKEEEEKTSGKHTGRRKSKVNSERKKALRFELKSATSMYDSVVGVSSRIKWKRRMKWLQSELRGLESSVDDIF